MLLFQPEYAGPLAAFFCSSEPAFLYVKKLPLLACMSCFVDGPW